MRDSYSRKYQDFDNDSEYELLETLQSKKQVLSMSDTHKSNDLSSICYAILEELSKTPNYPIKKCQNCGMYFIMQVRKDKTNTKLAKDFETWKKKAKEKINDMKKGKLTENEVYKWLIHSK